VKDPVTIARLAEGNIILVATDDLRTRGLVHKHAPKWVDARAVDDMYQVFTWEAKELAEQYTQSDESERRGSCQSDYNRIRFGNIMAATHAANIICKAIRKESFPPYVIGWADKELVAEPAPESNFEWKCSFCGKKVAKGNLWLCSPCNFILCYGCSVSCSGSCFHKRRRFTRLFGSVRRKGNRVVIELEVSKPGIAALDELEEEYDVASFGNKLSVAKQYSPIIVISEKPVKMKPVKIVQRWTVLPSGGAILEGIRVFPVEKITRPFHPNVSQSNDLCTGSREIRTATPASLAEAIRKNFEVAEAVLNGASDVGGYYEWEVIWNYVESKEKVKVSQRPSRRFRREEHEWHEWARILRNYVFGREERDRALEALGQHIEWALREGRRCRRCGARLVVRRCPVCGRNEPEFRRT